MNATSKDSTPKNIVQKPLSVYSLNFSEILTDDEREFLMARVKPKKSALIKPVVGNARRNVRRGGAFFVIAIAAIAVMHFTFQLSFITREKAALTHQAVPALQIQAAPVPVVADIQAAEYEVQATENPPAQLVAPAMKSRPSVAPPSVNLAPKRKEPTVSRAERLRRAERILTGV